MFSKGLNGTNSEVQYPESFGITTLLRYGRSLEYRTLSLLNFIVDVPTSSYCT